MLVDDDGVVKLIDFGLSNFADSSEKSTSFASPGQKRFMAPELHVGEELLHNPATDIYSFAQLCWQVCYHDLYMYTIDC